LAKCTTPRPCRAIVGQKSGQILFSQKSTEPKWCFMPGFAFYHVRAGIGNPTARKIRLRACIRIGELSRDLETSKGGSNPQATLPSDRKSKTETLADAGISTSTANRYEELAGGKEKQAQDVATAAADSSATGWHQSPPRAH
jgi:hypothetical protein